MLPNLQDGTHSIFCAFSLEGLLLIAGEGRRLLLGVLFLLF